MPNLSININCPFSLFASCSVEYDGRAYSTLELGNYLIIHKPDDSVMIHGSDLIVPRNYMCSCTKAQIIDNTIVFVRKSEKIIITVHDVLSLSYHENWSNHKIKICRTEKDLVDKICNNWQVYFQDQATITREYPTDLGPIDILGQTDDLCRVIEVKRKRATIKDVSQLKRYVEAITKSGIPKDIIGYLAAPDIGDKAKQYLENSGLYYLRVLF